MGSVISMNAFRESKDLHLHNLSPGARGRPRVSDKDLFSRDYTEFENILFGLFKVREILDYHLHYSEEWKYHLLCILDGVYRTHVEGKEHPISGDVAEIKRYVAEDLSEANKRDLSLALLLLDIIDRNVGEDGEEVLR